MPQPVDIEPFLTWLRQALRLTSYGEVGVLFYLRGGQIVGAKRVHNETYRSELEPGLPDPVDMLKGKL